DDLRLEEYLAGGAVDDRDRLTREVDEDLLAGLVLLAQHPVQAATPPAVALTEVAVLQPGRVRFLVLEPEQMKRHARTALRLHLRMDRRPVRQRPGHVRRHRGRKESPLQRRVREIVRKRPAQRRCRCPLQILPDRAACDPHALCDRSLRLACGMEPRCVLDRAHGPPFCLPQLLRGVHRTAERYASSGVSIVQRRSLTGWPASTGIGGRNHRNGWPASAGISGRDGPESVAGFRRNRRPDSTGIRRRSLCEARATRRELSIPRPRHHFPSPGSVAWALRNVPRCSNQFRAWRTTRGGGRGREPGQIVTDPSSALIHLVASKVTARPCYKSVSRIGRPDWREGFTPPQNCRVIDGYYGLAITPRSMAYVSWRYSSVTASNSS